MHKDQFPLFAKHPELIYLDSAATSFKPAPVIAAEREYSEAFSTNVTRGLYPLAEATTERVAKTRKVVAQFLNSAPEEIIFTSGTTASLNMAASMLEHLLSAECHLVVTDLEHHSNYLPWKELAKRSSAEFRVAQTNKAGSLDEKGLRAVLDTNTAIVALTAVSNVTGSIQDIPALIRVIRSVSPEAIVIVDAAQMAAHLPIDVQAWDADMVAFSGHKMYGPTGIGILYGKQALLETLPPAAFGGGMVQDACAPETAYREVPSRFEAGTPNVAAIFGLGAAIEFLQEINWDALRAHDLVLTEYALTALQKAFGQHLRIIGSADPADHAGIVSFTLSDAHPHDIAHLLGERNICVRAGEHCAAPLHRALGLSATTRISFGIYNELSDIDQLIAALKESCQILQPTA